MKMSLIDTFFHKPDFTSMKTLDDISRAGFKKTDITCLGCDVYERGKYRVVYNPVTDAMASHYEFETDTILTRLTRLASYFHPKQSGRHSRA